MQELEALLGGRSIDVLFIDGDHSTEGMLQDFRDYAPLVRKGGIIAVHDIYYLPTVAEAWKQVPGGQRFESKQNQSSIGIGFIIKE
jgi:predicted O-methyltransferase YrrM